MQRSSSCQQCVSDTRLLVPPASPVPRAVTCSGTAEGMEVNGPAAAVPGHVQCALLSFLVWLWHSDLSLLEGKVSIPSTQGRLSVPKPLGDPRAPQLPLGPSPCLK